jgi:hypothetical protein
MSWPFGLRLAVVLGAIAVAGAPSPAPAQVPGQIAAKAPADPDEQEALLLQGEVIASKKIGKGVTNPFRLTLRHGGVVHDAAYQNVDARKDEIRFRSGRTELQFRDFYGYNIAAYKLARLLGYDDLVPASVERQWKGRRGAFTWWVDKKWDEDERVKLGVQPPDVPRWERQLYLARAFTQLVDDTDRNLGNQLVTADFHLWMIDFTRAFRHTMELKSPSILRRIDRRFYERLKTVSDEEIKAALTPWVEMPAVQALLARRKAMVEHFAGLADQRSEQSVVFYEESGRPQENP